MNLRLQVVIAAVVLNSATSLGQGLKDCKPSTPSTSSAYQLFLRSGLNNNWSSSAFGAFRQPQEAQFHECAKAGGYIGFSGILSQSQTSARSLGYANVGNEHKALVFDVNSNGSDRIAGQARRLDGTVVFTFTMVNGGAPEVQMIGGGSSCSGIYVSGLLGTIGLTTLGPIGFAAGMAGMMFSLYDAGCI